MSTINPVEAMQTIRDAYLRYLRTVAPFQDRILKEAFRSEIERAGVLVKGPLLEAAPPFAPGRSIELLVKDAILHPRFQQLCSEALPYHRPLYLHQDRAITHMIQSKRNVIVATGTGSGKTESFLLPILNHLLQEQEEGTLNIPGVRALLLYPMNALANDQSRRLRRVLKEYPAITFGRYTGETEERDSDAEDRFHEQFPHEPLLPNELLSRSKMRAKPPHILLTNYAMLEYLLLRPEDCELFDGIKGKHWRYIVLDEAHIYDGASGIELAMLLRRLKDRIMKSEPGRLRCIATSATLGRGRHDFPVAVEFASNLFGEIFEWNEYDEQYQDVIDATRQPLAALGMIWGEGIVQLYTTLQELSNRVQNAEDIDDVIHPVKAALDSLLPPSVLDQAYTSANEVWRTRDEMEPAHKGIAAAALNAFLYAILCGDLRIHHLHEYLIKEPAFIEDVAQKVFPNDPLATRNLVTLVDLAVRAHPQTESLALLPARYHAFARALEGVFACLNADAHADHLPRLFLNRHEICPECDGWVIELAACIRCGAAYIVGTLVSEYASNSPHLATGDFKLQQLLDGKQNQNAHPGYFLLGDQSSYIDEDDTITSSDEIGFDQKKEGDPYKLCFRCGTLFSREDAYCRCGTTATAVRRIKLADGKELEPRKCIHCGAHSNNMLILRALTGQDAPVSVLATALYQQIPASSNPEALDLPGEGRKLLVFSDSRQDAAFFAPYLERTYNQVLRRRLMLQALLVHPVEGSGVLRLQDAVSYLLQESEHAGMFKQSQSRFERQRTVKTWLMQELTALDRTLSLEGVGLLQFRLVPPLRWKAPDALRSAPWNLSEDEIWTIIVLLLNTLRQQGVTTFLADVDPKDESFAPRAKEFFVRGEGSDSATGILSWLPMRGSNRRQDILERLLARCVSSMSSEQQKQHAQEALRGIWKHLAEPRSVWRDHLVGVTRAKNGVVYRLSHEFWELIPLTQGQDVYRCDRCRSCTSLYLKGLCPVMGCSGELRSCSLMELRQENKHYVELYLSVRPLPLIAEEHTAQWTSDEAGKVQERFIRGETNVLSCSTTFELGVDVGELQAVLMRNMPPTTANYVQRAGRAGRRTDSAAFILTFAQRRSHDFTHYSHPQRIVAGQVSPPRIMLANEKIIRRHMYAVLIAAFFRQIFEHEMRSFKTLGLFFQPEETIRPGSELLGEFAKTRPPMVLEALERIVPLDMQSDIGMEDWTWLRTSDDDGMLDLLDRVTAEVTEDLKLYEDAEANAARERSYGLSAHYQSVIRTIRSRSLLGFLATRNLLPKYGFPTDVVELKTDHLPEPEARRVRLERDLRIAIAEYAPGAEVVAAKHIWIGGGLYKQPMRGWPEYRYAICLECNRFIRRKVEEELENVCKCGNTLSHHGKTYIVPEFGFVAAPSVVRKAGENRPQRLYASRIYFTEYAKQPNEPIVPDLKPMHELSSAYIEVSSYYSRFGKLALVNEGKDERGFRICQECGFAEMAPSMPQGKPKRLTKSKPHINPRTRNLCEGFIKTHQLGHDFLTDVIEIRFEGLWARQAGKHLWRSLLYALLEGASEALSIRRDDLDGTLYFPRRGAPPALMLFDNVPGGAGHVKRVRDELYAVFNAAYARVHNECCGPETSCYECLRNYRNQPYHDELVRGVVDVFLSNIISTSNTLES